MMRSFEALAVFSVVVLLAVTPFSFCEAKRLKDRIYVSVPAAGFCFRRTNGTHQIGCSSDRSGNVGVIHLIEEPDDLTWLIEKGQHEPYTAVFTPDLFNQERLGRLRDSGKVSGVVLLQTPESESEAPSAYSDDAACPNSVSSLYAGTSDQCNVADAPWNPSGLGTMYESFPFPIFLITNQTAADQIVNCSTKYNKPEGSETPSYPLCSLELTSHMYSAVDTTTCLRRSNMGNALAPVSFCDEMGDYNVFYFVEERNASHIDADKEKVILVTTQLDAMNLFDFNEVGADSPSTNIVALLETAALIAEDKPSFGGGLTNVLFAFMNGEAFDYIGSSRMVYDMKEKSFPNKVEEGDFVNGLQPVLDLSHIDHIVTLGQLFNVKSNGRLYAHTDTEFTADQLVESLSSSFSSYGAELTKASGRKGLPPSSIHSFLKESRALPGVHISDFDQQFTNDLYHSLYDSAKVNINYNYSTGDGQEVVEHISKVSEALADYLYAAVEGRRGRLTFSSNRTRVNEMLHCYVENSDCKLFNAAANKYTPPFYGPFPKDRPLPQYVGVDKKSTHHAIFTRNLLAYLTAGDPIESIEKREDCKAPEDQNVYEYIFLKGESVPPHWTGDKKCNETSACGFCFKTTTFRRHAKSPAYVIDNYDYADAKYSAWAESSWKTTEARLFLVSSPSLQLGHFFIGLFVLIASFAGGYWGTKKAPELFNDAAGTGENGGSSNGSGTVTTHDSVVAAGSHPDPARL